MRRLGSRVKEGRVPGTAASEVGVGAERKEEGRSEDGSLYSVPEANTEGRLCLGQRKKSHHR